MVMHNQDVNKVCGPVPEMSRAFTEPATGFDLSAVRLEARRLPENPNPYADTYFKRTHQILEAEGFNPWVRAQVFLRQGPGTLHGVNEALAILERYTAIREVGGGIKALPEGTVYSPLEAVLTIEAPVQEIIKFETMYLGVLAAATTAANDGVQTVDLAAVTERTRALKAIIGDRPLIYMGARHWRWQEDAAIAEAAFAGGATDAATDIGAETAGKSGIGTIPHALEVVMASTYGTANAVVEATRAFDRVIAPSVPRIALVDFNNCEIHDALATANALGSRLYGVRIDTCGENVAQGACATYDELRASELGGIEIDPVDLKYWFGRGVTVSGVLAIRKALNNAGHGDKKIVLSSGFASPKKAGAFVRAEKLLVEAGVLDGPLFDAVGVGGVFEPCRTTTMDIVAVADSRSELDHHPISKVGRSERPNSRLSVYL